MFNESGSVAFDDDADVHMIDNVPAAVMTSACTGAAHEAEPMLPAFTLKEPFGTGPSSAPEPDELHDTQTSAALSHENSTKNRLTRIMRDQPIVTSLSSS